MPLSKVTTNVSGVGIGRQPLNADKISGILFYAASYPSGFSSGSPVVKMNSLADAVAAGITGTAQATFGVLYYQISEFFRINPQGTLYVGIYPAGTYTYTEVKNMQDIALGVIRQFGVYAGPSGRTGSTNVVADVATLQGVLDTCTAAGFHCSAILALNWQAQASWGTAPTIRAGATQNKVSVIIGQDGGAVGASLFTSNTTSVPALGAALGCLSKALVCQSIGNPSLFNVSNGVELETPALANGQSLQTVTYATLGTLKDNGYLVLRKYSPQIPGTFFERCPTGVLATDTYAWIEFVRTIDKAKRTCESTLTPLLQSSLAIDSTGKLRQDTIGYFTDILNQALDQMKAAGEIVDRQVLIDPNQNVQSTSTLVVTVKILPFGVAEFITVNIGLVSSF